MMIGCFAWIGIEEGEGVDSSAFVSITMFTSNLLCSAVGTYRWGKSHSPQDFAGSTYLSQLKSGRECRLRNRDRNACSRIATTTCHRPAQPRFRKKLNSWKLRRRQGKTSSRLPQRSTTQLPRTISRCYFPRTWKKSIVVMLPEMGEIIISPRITGSPIYSTPRLIWRYLV